MDDHELAGIPALQLGIASGPQEIVVLMSFGYSTDRRSMTQGKGTFSMEFLEYRRVPQAIQDEIIAKQKSEMAKTK